jgi:hypothetical protein
MNKNLLTLAGVAVLIPILYIGTVLAGNQIKLFINYKETKPDAPLQIKNGVTTGPIRQLCEALGANVEWDNKTNSVEIIDAKKIQVEQLESVLAPNDKLSAATLWAESAKTRNGALRYAILSSELRQKQYLKYKELNWVLGVSSPWVESYKVTENKSTDNTYNYEIAYVLTDSTGTKYSAKEGITVKKTNVNGYDKWLVINSNEPSWDIPQIIQEIKY